MRDFNFSGLTLIQQDVLTFQGWQLRARYPDGSVRRQPSRRSVQKLLDRGLVIAREKRICPVSLPVIVTEYEVPVAVHIAWRQFRKEREADHV